MYFHLSVKLLVGFVVLFIVARFIGGRELKQLTIFDFVTAIVLSELVGNVLYSEKVDALHMSYALLFWGLLIYLVEKIKLKFARTRKVFEGVPALVIEESRIQREILKKHRMDLNELLALLRQKDVFSIREVKYAFIETDGSVSLIKNKLEEDPCGATFPHPLILDGRLNPLSVDRLGKDLSWIEQKVREQGYPTIKQILYAEYSGDDRLYIQAQPEVKQPK